MIKDYREYAKKVREEVEKKGERVSDINWQTVSFCFSREYQVKTTALTVVAEIGEMKEESEEVVCLCCGVPEKYAINLFIEGYCESCFKRMKIALPYGCQNLWT